MEVIGKSEEITVNFEIKKNSPFNTEQYEKRKFSKANNTSIQLRKIKFYNHFFPFFYYKLNVDNKYISKFDFFEDILMVKNEKKTRNIKYEFYYIVDYFYLIETFIVFNLPFNLICVNIKNLIEDIIVKLYNRIF